MQVGEQDLILAEHLPLNLLRFLDLNDHVVVGEHGLRVGDDLRARPGEIRVGEAGAEARAELPVKVKVFVAAMFEIGQNTGDRAGEFQHWYERYWKGAKPMAVPGALQPVYCNAGGVCGAVLGNAVGGGLLGTLAGGAAGALGGRAVDRTITAKDRCR